MMHFDLLEYLTPLDIFVICIAFHHPSAIHHACYIVMDIVDYQTNERINRRIPTL